MRVIAPYSTHKILPFPFTETTEDLPRALMALLYTWKIRRAQQFQLMLLEQYCWHKLLLLRKKSATEYTQTRVLYMIGQCQAIHRFILNRSLPFIQYDPHTKKLTTWLTLHRQEAESFYDQTWLNSASRQMQWACESGTRRAISQLLQRNRRHLNICFTAVCADRDQQEPLFTRLTRTWEKFHTT